MDHLKQIENDMKLLVTEWEASGFLTAGDLFVIGCSTSEVAGEQIGTAGSEEVAEIIFQSLQELSKSTGAHLVFQCCEHLNRALVIERSVQTKLNMSEVSVIPVPSAGGSMASYAFRQLEQATVVEAVQADAGMDVGETLIGMHLKPVAVPVRFKQNTLGNARIIAARTRPKLIGGNRAQYA